MSQTYMSRHRTLDSSKTKQAPRSKTPGPSLDALKGGAMPSREQMGHRVDLPEAIRTRMESSFGMDFSGVELHESEFVADAGAEAITMGNKISFAPGRLDLASKDGQAILGHELSHVASQARGEVRGRGVLADHVLEARANREGAMAAAGRTVYTGPVTPVSTTSTALSAAGPMQAAKDDKRKQAKRESAKASMSQATSNLTPILRASIERASAPNLEDRNSDRDKRGLLKPTNANRFTHMRGNGGAGMREYKEALHASTEELNEKVRAGRFKNLSHLNNEKGYKQFLSGEELVGEKATRNADALAYQERALQNVREYLAAMSQDETAMNALREAADMYSSFGTYGQQNADGTLNTAGMNNGREEALNRAMNDILLRTYIPDSSATIKPYVDAATEEDKNKVLRDMRKKYGDDLTAEDLGRAREVDTALLAMHNKVLNRSTMRSMDEMTQYEREFSDMLNQFYYENGLIAGIKTSNNSFHYAEAEKRAIDGNINPETKLGQDAMLIALERQIKNPDPNESPAVRQSRIRYYIELRRGRYLVDWDSSKAYS